MRHIIHVQVKGKVYRWHLGSRIYMGKLIDSTKKKCDGNITTKYYTSPQSSATLFRDAIEKLQKFKLRDKKICPAYLIPKSVYSGENKNRLGRVRQKFNQQL